MLAISWLMWWYSQGWLELANRLRHKIKRTYLNFSVPLLVRTLGKPWRQMVTGKDPNAVVGQRLRAVVDNLVSRLVGLSVRVLTLLVAGVVLLLMAVGGIALLISWPLLPLAVVWLGLRSFGWR